MINELDSDSGWSLSSYSSSATLYNASSLSLAKLPRSASPSPCVSRCSPEPSPGPLQPLPTELLVLTLGLLDRASLSACLRVNSVFASVAFPLLYRRLSLGEGPWPSFQNASPSVPWYLNRGMLVHFVRVLELSPHSLLRCRDSGGWTTSLPPLPAHTLRINFGPTPLPYHPEGPECDSPLPCAALRHVRPHCLILRLSTAEVPRTAINATEVVLVLDGHVKGQASLRQLPRKCGRVTVILVGALEQDTAESLLNATRAWARRELPWTKPRSAELVGLTQKRVDEGRVALLPMRVWVRANDWKDVLSTEEARPWL